MKSCIYVFLTSYMGSKEGYESQISVLEWKLGYLCHTYNTDLNRRL